MFLYGKYRLSNLAVIGNDQFYFTNSWKYCLVMEVVFRLPFGSIGFYDGTHAELVETGLFIPNGIAVSNDGRCVTIFVCRLRCEEMTDRKHLFVDF